MANAKAYVGTSGWLYKHWRGTFYPPGLRTADEFAFYSLFFRTVELNNPFYRLPSRETFENWRINSRKDFLFVVKASRFITHMKKLHETGDALDLFLHNAGGLEEKLGPILFQLPPGWQVNVERLRDFLKQLPKGFRFAFEFRNPTWYTDEVYALLKKYNCAFCIYQLAGHMSPVVVTAKWVYLRLHGPTKNKYQGSYDFNTLRAWAEKSREWMSEGRDVYIYFDNDDSGYAAFNAQVIEMMLNKDEPITQTEADLMQQAILAIKQRKTLRFHYQDQWIELEPYIIALNGKGRGDLFVAGVEPNAENQTLHPYLLSEIEIKKFSIQEKGYDTLKVDEKKIYEPQPGLRLLYRTPLKAAKKNKAAKRNQ